VHSITLSLEEYERYIRWIDSTLKVEGLYFPNRTLDILGQFTSEMRWFRSESRLIVMVDSLIIYSEIDLASDILRRLSTELYVSGFFNTL